MTAALLALEKLARNTPEPDIVYALAELSWVEGRRLDRWRQAAAIDRYLDTVAYAFDFLFDPDPRLAEGRRPSDPRFRLACDLYNGGLERLHPRRAVGPADRGPTARSGSRSTAASRSCR